jgi:MoaA/NifB/PqqE/SkfB family radical SAM enzyme
METGGMKGRRKEITRLELHQQLKQGLSISHVHSEYGMSELLSQAYSKADGIFESVPWMKMFVRNDDDPLEVHETGEGIINIIDLANIYSCAFIATDDLGRIFPNDTFEILGRIDNSDIRGCSLLLT